MKNVKRIGALLLSAAMMAAVAATPAMALSRPDIGSTPATDFQSHPTDYYKWEMNWHPSLGGSTQNQITVTNVNDNHKFYAYQVFKGNLDVRQRFVTPTGYIPVPASTDEGYPAFSANLVTKVYNLGEATTAGYDVSALTAINTDTEMVHIFLGPMAPADLVGSPDATEISQARPVIGVDGMWYKVSTETQMNLSPVSDSVAGTYTVYEIANLNPEWEQSLRQMDWGNAITEAGKAGIYKLVTGSDISSALLADGPAAVAAVSNIMKGYDDSQAINFANKVMENKATWIDDSAKSASTPSGTDAIIPVPNAGYFLVEDTLINESVENSVISRYMLQVTGVVKLPTKSDLPTVEKKVYENSEYKAPAGAVGADKNAYSDDISSTHKNEAATTTEPGAGWNDIADYNIGDKVPFALVGTLPTNFGDYTKYNYVFHDSLSKSLDVVDASWKVSLMNGTVLTTLPASGFYTAVVNSSASDKNTFTVTMKDLKDPIWGSYTLNENTKIVVEYEAILNKTAIVGAPNATQSNHNKVYLEYSNNPNQGGEGDTGETPEDEVIVYTYELNVTKIANQQQNGNNVTLAGAHFILQRTSDDWYAVTDASGKVTEWTPYIDQDAYNAASPKLSTTWATEVISNGSGKLAFSGLDEGTFHLHETKAPSGYQPLPTYVEFTITRTHADTNSYNGNPQHYLGAGDLSMSVNHTGLSGSVDSTTPGNGTTGIVSMTVKNASGNQLPVTGGMGTTLFYIAGAVMTIGAGVVLVVKRRMNAE